MSTKEKGPITRQSDGAQISDRLNSSISKPHPGDNFKTPYGAQAVSQDRAKAGRHKKNVEAVLQLLAETWPAAFSIYENRRHPLKVGIYEEILAAVDGAITAAELGLALRCYVANRVYRSRLTAGTVRIGLDGQPAGVVTPEEVMARALLAQEERRQ